MYPKVRRKFKKNEREETERGRAFVFRMHVLFVLCYCYKNEQNEAIKCVRQFVEREVFGIVREDIKIEGIILGRHKPIDPLILRFLTTHMYVHRGVTIK